MKQRITDMIAQFQGEDRRESIVNHFSLDIEEEEDFFNYLDQMGYDEDSPDEILENCIVMWRKEQEK